MNLGELKIGEKAFIQKIHTSEKVKTRLLALGLFSGQEIEFLARAPFGDPYQYLVSGNLIVIRKNIAQLIEVIKI